MVTVADVVQQHRERAADYAKAGSCRLAASECQDWLRSRNVDSSRIEGVLVTPTGTSLRMIGGIVPPSTQINYSNIYQMTAPGIWSLQSATVGVVTAPKHELVSVCLVDGNVLVDWGLAQFEELPAGLAFYAAA